MAAPVIALVGMCGSGKSAASRFLEGKGYQGVYFGGLTMEELKARNLEINPDNEKKIREELREKHGMAAFAVLSIPKINALLESGSKIYIDGLYSWDEYKVLRDKLGERLVLIDISVDKKVRYGRLSNRNKRAMTREEAEQRDISEIENIAKGGPIAFADYKCLNNGSVEDLEQRLGEILEDLD